MNHEKRDATYHTKKKKKKKKKMLAPTRDGDEGYQGNASIHQQSPQTHSLASAPHIRTMERLDTNTQINTSCEIILQLIVQYTQNITRTPCIRCKSKKQKL